MHKVEFSLIPGTLHKKMRFDLDGANSFGDQITPEIKNRTKEEIIAGRIAIHLNGERLELDVDTENVRDVAQYICSRIEAVSISEESHFHIDEYGYDISLKSSPHGTQWTVSCNNKPLDLFLVSGEETWNATQQLKLIISQAAA